MNFLKFLYLRELPLNAKFTIVFQFAGVYILVRQMQFKKHFSSNLQNLSVKKTLIVNPPPHRSIYPHHNSSNNRPSLDESGLSLNSNKENQKDNQIIIEQMGRQNSKGRMSPVLTFNKIKKNTIDMMHKNQQEQEQLHHHNRQIFQPLLNQNANTRSNLFKTERANDSARNLHTFTSSNIHNSSKNIRLGSMVFASLLKKDPNQSNANNIRDSRSIDRMSTFKTERDQTAYVQCINGDGQQAKYKVIQGQEELQCYCFNCAILLVKQGFSIEQLTLEDKKRLKIRQSHCMSRSDFHQQRQSELSGSRFSCPRGNGMGERVKIGEQVKCRVIMRLNKLRVAREQFNKSIEAHLQNIDYFYHALSAHIQQQRLADRQEILRMKGIRKAEPENYESQLSSSLGTIDYMMKNLQGVNNELLGQVEALLENEVSYPKMRINVQPVQGFQGRIQQFSQYFDRNLKIFLSEDNDPSFHPRSRISSLADDKIEITRNHPLRFSFEEALQQMPKKGSNLYHGERSINPLQEENESQLEESLPMVGRRQNAFRNLFPEDDFSDSDFDRPKQSPVFKQF